MYSIQFIWVIFSLIVILFISLFYLALRLLYSKNSALKKIEWKKTIDPLIQQSLLFDKRPKAELYSALPERMKKRLKRPSFRNYMIQCLSETRQSVGTNGSDKICLLYEQLNLHEDSFRKLNNPDWNIVIEGIQELAIMNQKKHIFKLLDLINNKNEFVRMEAQSAFLWFYKSDGLCFLTLDPNDLCQWQQIRLLQQVHRENIENVSHLNELLRASNVSVVIFALKLIRSKKLIELCNSVIPCLRHVNPQVRIESLKCLNELHYLSTDFKRPKKQNFLYQEKVAIA